MIWKKYGMSFITPTSSVVLLMISNVPGIAGNDFIVDDIQLRICSDDDEIKTSTGTTTFIDQDEYIVI
jgi:hypothetical protein